MIATLPMYDWAEVRPATDRYWGLIRDALRDHGLPAPEALDRSGGYTEAWLRPDLVLSQTCGLPYRAALHGRVTLVGAPDYGLPDTPPGYYHSVLVVAADREGTPADFFGARLAINGFDSQSGWGAPQNFAAAAGAAFADIVVTGAHVHSAQAVAEGRADIAAIDAQSWRLVERHRPVWAARLRILARTPPTPATPYITALSHDPAPYALAVASAIAALSEADRAALDLRGFERVPASAYLAVPTPALPAQHAGDLRAN
ncbi:MAG: PhnD/SsuA/transferrin family substrate-binding protein [Rhodobacteraceae bacterium]|nr:PhnD/SsuA/transferrin family substrate-binding protein [Paracoccaceae bacterium]